MKKNIDIKDKKTFLCILLISNLLIYLLADGNEGTIEYPQTDVILERPDYKVFKVKAELQTKFEPNTPISIINKAKNLYIPHAILIEKGQQRPSEIDEDFEQKTTNEFTIYIHKDFIPKLIEKKNLIILPHINKNLITKKRSSYEISF